MLWRTPAKNAVPHWLQFSRLDDMKSERIQTRISGHRASRLRIRNNRIWSRQLDKDGLLGGVDLPRKREELCGSVGRHREKNAKEPKALSLT